jgi:hypothetical protein
MTFLTIHFCSNLQGILAKANEDQGKAGPDALAFFVYRTKYPDTFSLTRFLQSSASKYPDTHIPHRHSKVT